jgi:4-amino-4-deoxy-L-arabinose transferase-like glycosyltransferase
VRRLLRIAFNALTVLSLVLTLLVAGLWVRSLWAFDSIDWESGCPGTFQTAKVELFAGSIMASCFSMTGPEWATEPNDDGHFSFFSDEAPQLKLTDHPRLPRFGWTNEPYRSGTKRTIVLLMPLYLIFAVSLLMPALWLRTRRNRRKPGVCPRCGYDLRATLDRCPECGAVPSQPAQISN